MKLSLSLIWRIFVFQGVASLMLFLCLRNTALMTDAALMPLKPTIGFLIAALALVAAQVGARISLVRTVFGARLELPGGFWRALSFALALCYLVLALANFVVARAVPFETWLVYKTFAPLIILLAFVAIVPPRLLAPAAERLNPTTEQFELRYSFDTGSGVCLWAANNRTRERFGYPVDLRALDLPDAVVLQGEQLLTRFDASMDWNNAPAEIWSASERLSFAADAQAFFLVLRASLAPDFDISNGLVRPPQS